MPRLRKSFIHKEPSDSQIFEKYTSFEEKQTQIPQPTDEKNENQDSQSRSPKKKPISRKKANRSLKKSNKNEEQNILPTERTAKRKSRKKKVDQSPYKTEGQNQQEHNILSPQHDKKPKSSRKNKKSLKKTKNTQTQQQFQRHQQTFNDNQLRSKVHQQDEILQKGVKEQDERLNKSDSQRSAVNFNRRLKKKIPIQKQDLNILLSRYTEDEGQNAFGNRITQDDSSNGQIGTRYQSDLRDLEILVKKKQKKPKKEKEIKIKNKYFSDISMSQSNEIQEKISFQGEDPPQNSEQLIIQKKQPRKTIHNLNEVIEKRVNHIKDRRQFKSSEGDMKFKNHIKTKLQQVKDAQQVQVDIQVPNLFTKKTASAALYMKNTLQTEEKMAKFSQPNTENDKKLLKISSNLQANKSQETLTIQQRKNQQFMLKMKKKGVKRDDFYNHLTKEIKSKRQTNINSQEIKDCFKTSNLDEQNFDVQLAQDLLSNCSSRSVSRQSISRVQRRMSVDSQKSIKSQESIKSNNSKKEFNKESLSKSIVKTSSKWNIQMNVQVSENSNSKSIFTNRSSRHVSNFINPPISEVKQSDASSSYRHIDNSRSFFNNKPIQQSYKNSLRFDDESIKEEVQKSLKKTFQILQSENQPQLEKNHFKETVFKDPFNKTMSDVIQEQKESDKKLEEKLKNIVKTKNKKNSQIQQNQQKNVDVIDDMLGDNLDQGKQSRQQKRSKRKQKKNKNKKIKNKFRPDDYESFFEVEADYSSSEQGHTDQQFQSQDSDLDQQGNILGLIDKDTEGLKINQKRVKKKFLQDQQKRDQQMIERIMKGLYGRKKLEQTDSEKRLRKRMQQAAKKNLLDDLDQINGKDTETFRQTQKPNNQIQKFPQRQNQNDENSRELRKLKEFQQQLAIGGHGRKQFQGNNVRESSINETWKLFNPSLPVKKTIHPSMINRPSIGPNRTSVDKNKQHRKSIFDTKKGTVQQQIFNKTITNDRPRPESTGNRNKLQKTSQIHLDIRNTNVNFENEIQF